MQPTTLISKQQQQDILRNYQNNISLIHKEKRKILNALNQKYKEKHYLIPTQINTFKSKSSLTQLQPHTRKLVKLSSQNQPKNTMSITQKQSKNQLKVDDKQSTKKVEVPKAIADRNKRIFGGLTSHLKKAGQHLKSQQFKQKQRNAKEILNKLIEKEKQQREQVQNKKREELETQIKKLQQEKKQIDEKLLANENMMLTQIVKVHLNTIGNFNMTRSQPKISWKPSKPLEMAEKQDKIKQSTQKYLKKLQEEWLSNVAGYNKVSDHSNYMTQNQRQFYNNFIGRIYRQYDGFVLTNSEPQIFWKPKISSTKIQNLFADTKSVLEEKSIALKKVNEDFYLSKKSNPQDQFAKEILDEENEDQQDFTLKPLNE